MLDGSTALAGPIEELCSPASGTRRRTRTCARSTLARPASATTAVGGQAAVMSACGGGTLDTARDRLLVWGGGHGDYAGNELCAFDLATLQWSRLTEPSSSP